MNGLKPCPFCNADVELSVRNSIQGDNEYMIWCTGCVMRFSKSEWANGYDKSKVIEDWNRRAYEND